MKQSRVDKRHDGGTDARLKLPSSCRARIARDTAVCCRPFNPRRAHPSSFVQLFEAETTPLSTITSPTHHNFFQHPPHLTSHSPQPAKMADPASSPPQLRVSGLPSLSGEDAAATTSPARGAEMKSFLQARLQKNRAPPLVHTWDFYHDRQDRTHSTNLSNLSASTSSNGNGSQPSQVGSENGNAGVENGGIAEYEARLEHLAVIDDVRKFWNVFNNFPLWNLALRDSIHLFHKGVKPVWEDPRNARGGSWTFRVQKDRAEDFWREICMMAIGEQLQQAVEDPTRKTFRDDICGVSLGVRFNSMLIQIWNRDGEHQAGTERVLNMVIENLSEELQPRDGSYYYKKHSEHAGFSAPIGNAAGSSSGSESAASSRPASSMGQQLQQTSSIDAVLSGGS